LLACLAVACVSGCGSFCTVSGEATYDGQPIEDGMVNFLPADGKGPSAGGPIRQGRYSVAGLQPGPKIVQVRAVKQVNFARSQQEMEEMAAAARARGDTTGIIERADIIPPDAVGNNATLDVKPGPQTHHLVLKKPAEKQGR
jgi:hypothetical protein